MIELQVKDGRNGLFQNSFEEVNYVSFEFNGLDARQMERVFNSLPYELQNLTRVERDTFKKHLDD